MIDLNDLRKPLGEGLPRGYHPGKAVVLGGETADSSASTLTAGGVANTKGSWVELTSALVFDADGFYVSLNNGFARARYYVDIGIGGAGSEVVICPDLFVYTSLNGQASAFLYIPLHIPGGVRIAARCQSSTGLNTIDLQLIPVASKALREKSFRRATHYGLAAATTTSDSLVDPSNTANTKGSYDEIVASTTNAIEAFILFAVTGTGDVASSRTILLDLAKGGAGSEVLILENLFLYESSAVDAYVPGFFGPIYLPLPAGTALTARCQASLASLAGQVYVSVLGFD